MSVAPETGCHGISGATVECPEVVAETKKREGAGDKAGCRRSEHDD